MSDDARSIIVMVLAVVGAAYFVVIWSLLGPHSEFTGKARTLSLQTAPLHPTIKLPCQEDEIPVVVDHRYVPTADDIGFWDGDRYFRICQNIDD